MHSVEGQNEVGKKMPYIKSSHRFFASAAVVLAIASPSWPADGKRPVSTPTAIAVVFKLDPRLASGVYGGERWISPSPYITTLNPVVARVYGIDEKGSSVPISPDWIAADPEVVSVSPGRGEQVTITIKRAGQSSLRINSHGLSKELEVRATSNGTSMQVEISQPPGVRAGGAGTNQTSVPKSDDRAAGTEGASLLQSPGADLAPGSRPLQNQQERLSYALGANLGNGLRREAIEVDADLMVQGLKDALSGSALRLTQHEISIAVAGLKTELTSKRITAAADKINAAKQLAEKNKTEGEAFLAENKTRDGVITLDSGLQYKILKKGEGKKPAPGDTVVCNYRGTLIDGTEFDSSHKRKEPATFVLGRSIKGWNEALQLMPAGSKWQLYVPSHLAYAERGANIGIGPNAALIFEVELLSVKDTLPGTQAAKQAGALPEPQPAPVTREP
jgi:FKBP-type peptidyl-prolyl cis-trans isomerase FklB